MNKIPALTIAIISYLFLFPQSALAQGCAPGYSIPTAIGNVCTTPLGFTKQILDIVIGVAGGIAFIVILIGAFKLITSRGDPEALAEGRSVITAGIAGLIVIIFAVFLLKIIGVDILGLPITKPTEVPP